MPKVRFVITTDVQEGTPVDLIDFLAADLARHVSQATFATVFTVASWEYDKYPGRTLMTDLEEGRY